MASFANDTEVSGGEGRYRARLSRDWEVWGPFGGYVAAIALRALGRESELARPASVSIHFLAPAAFDDVDIEVIALRRGKRTHAMQAVMSQKGNAVLVATGWVAAGGMRGLEHDHAIVPVVPGPKELRSYSELSDHYEEWYPIWHGAVDGRPTVWDDNPAPAPPLWHTWMRLVEPMAADDPFLDAARSLMWLDMMMWNAAVPPHMPWPISHLAPSLDLTAIFHAGSGGDEWLLCDSHAPVASDNLIGCNGRVWTESGRLVASGTSALFCRPNPQMT